MKKKNKVFGFEALTPTEQEAAKKLGYNGMFSEREKVQEIYDYILMLPDGQEKIVAITGLSMLQNFFSCYIAKNFEPKKTAKDPKSQILNFGSLYFFNK